MFKSDKKNKPFTNEDDSCEYEFLIEEIKLSREMRRRKLVIDFGVIIIMGVVFGFASAVSFNGFISIFSDDNSQPNVELETVEVNNNRNQNISLDKANEMMAAVVQEVKPAIVNVTSVRTGEDWFQNVSAYEIQGTGVIVAQKDDEIMIVTSKTLIEYGKKVYVSFEDGTSKEAKIIGTDVDTDIAVLTIDAKTLSFSTKQKIKKAVFAIGEDKQVGDVILQIGNTKEYGCLAYMGIISSVTQKVAVTDGEMSLILTQFQGIQAQNGGALTNLDGEIVGIILTKFVKENTGQLSTVVPIEEAQRCIEDIMNHTKSPYLGVKGKNINKELADGLKIPQGIYITEVNKASPAEEAGIEKGDIIVAIEDEEEISLEKLEKSLYNHKKNDKLVLKMVKVLHKDVKEFDVTVKLN